MRSYKDSAAYQRSQRMRDGEPVFPLPFAHRPARAAQYMETAKMERRVKAAGLA